MNLYLIKYKSIDGNVSQVESIERKSLYSFVTTNLSLLTQNLYLQGYCYLSKSYPDVVVDLDFDGNDVNLNKYKNMCLSTQREYLINKLI